MRLSGTMATVSAESRAYSDLRLFRDGLRTAVRVRRRGIKKRDLKKKVRIQLTKE